MNCPICDQPVRPTDLECAGCGESLIPWNTLRKNGEALRQRALVFAHNGDYCGAIASFLEAALTNPQDDKSLLDAARAMAHLGRVEDCDRLLAAAAARPALKPTAEEMRKVLRAHAVADGEATPTPPVEPTAIAAASVQQGNAPEPLPAAAETAAESRRPLLALGVCTPPGWFRKQPSTFWLRILEKETAGSDWTGAPAPLAEMLAYCKEERAAVQYMLGLSRWQGGDNDGARIAFRASIAEKPQVLNPYAYWVYIHLDDARMARQARDELGSRKLLGKEVATCLAVLDEHLGKAKSPLQTVVRQLRD